MRWMMVAAFAVVGCNGGETHEEGPICAEIMEVCHEASEGGDAEAVACHDVAHEADEAACEEQRDACVETCSAITGA
ncbi:MAG: hypothetical protein ABMA64_26010 [Myxococcota bacterium]